MQENNKDDMGKILEDIKQIKRKIVQKSKEDKEEKEEKDED